MSYRKQTYYHDDRDFDFEKFFQSIYSFVVPIIEGEQLLITTTFVYEDEEGKPYASYRIPKEYEEKEPEFADEAAFLEQYPIDLTYEGGSFSVQKMYQQFENLDLLESEVLQAQIIEEYFREIGIETPSPDVHDFTKMPSTWQNFLLAEKIYLKVAMESKKIYNGDSPIEHIPFFWPIPIISQACLVGVMYIVASPKAFRGKGKDKLTNIQQYHRLLILMATREYENVRLESKFERYAIRPQEPLEDFLTIFQDLNSTEEKDKRKKIEYIPMYGYPDSNEKPLTTNPFLCELGYDDYYEKLAPVIIAESKQLRRGRKDKIKTAITAIIVDSFAHNIGAHSLVALKWWFENRYKIAASPFPVKNKLYSKIDATEIGPSILTNIQKTNSFHEFMDAIDRSTNSGKDTEETMLSLLGIVRFMDEATRTNLLTYRDKEEAYKARFPVPVAQSLYQFFQYLRDKSAFWSGVARDTVFSGEIKSWADLIRQYLNNTLFLGTIAHSEGINRLAIHIEIIEPENEAPKPKVMISGEYAIINLEVMEREKAKSLGLPFTQPPEDPQGYSEYAFLRKGNDFESIQPVLESLDDVFLPNGVIGQHALYTILENTLRNVKHYKKQLKSMQEGGVKLYISIQSVHLRKERSSSYSAYVLSEEQSLFKVGTWLHHPQKLHQAEGAKINEEKSAFYKTGGVIESHTQQLRKRVIDKEGNPILGGSAQDKVCAAMLMNNRFLSIDDVDQRLIKRHYYPYVFAASEFYTERAQRTKGFAIEDTILHKIYNPALLEKKGASLKAEYKKAVIQYLQEVETRFAERPDDETYARGTIKKYFHLWKGRKAKVVNGDFDPKNENLSRFKIVAIEEYAKRIDGKDVKLPFTDKEVSEEKPTALYEVRNKGIIRVVKADASLIVQEKQSQYEWAMQQWLGSWLDNGERQQVYLLSKPQGDSFTPVAGISMKPEEGQWSVQFLHEKALRRNREIQMRLRENPRAFTQLHIAHGEEYIDAEDCCQLRSHASFFQDIFRYQDPNGQLIEHDFKSFTGAEFPTLDGPMKLLETGMTYISFFDARVHERLPLDATEEHKQKRFKVFPEQLRIEAFPEKGEVFEKQRKTLLQKRGHFLVMHLSFLETLKKPDGRRYRESEVQEFFQAEIKGWYEKEFKTDFPDNIVLVIVSGRGRGDWFMATKNPQITFRPIEVILDAIEDGLSLKDDFQVKFNLCNVFFGS